MRDLFFSLIFLYCFVSMSSYAQNLLPNPSFEDINICTEHSAPCAPSGWIMTSPFLAEYSGRPGEKHVSLIGFNSSQANVRQYIQTRIMCPLVQGETYLFSLRMKQSECNLGSLGILFSDSLIYTNKDELISIQPTIDLTHSISSFSKKKQQKWITIETNYVATGNEKYLLIGNFQGESEQSRSFIEKEKAFSTYRYSLDDISLTDPKSDSICESAQDVKVHWYNYQIRHSPVRISEFEPSKPIEEPTIIDLVNHVNEKVDSIRLSDVIFEFNSAKLSEEAKVYITDLFKQIDISSIDKITIEGHTDSIGKREYNRELSVERAVSVKELLTEMGISENSIETSGKGDSSPIADNGSEEGRRKNRRIELVVFYK